MNLTLSSVSLVSSVVCNQFEVVHSRLRRGSTFYLTLSYVVVVFWSKTKDVKRVSLIIIFVNPQFDLGSLFSRWNLHTVNKLLKTHFPVRLRKVDSIQPPDYFSNLSRLMFLLNFSSDNIRRSSKSENEDSRCIEDSFKLILSLKLYELLNMSPRRKETEKTLFCNLERP